MCVGVRGERGHPHLEGSPGVSVCTGGHGGKWGESWGCRQCGQWERGRGEVVIRVSLGGMGVNKANGKEESSKEAMLRRGQGKERSTGGFAAKGRGTLGCG